MKRWTGRFIACLAAVAGLGSFGGSTAHAGITLVITVSDSSGTATETITNTTANSVTYDNVTGIFTPNAIITSTSGDPGVFSRFQIQTTGSTNTPGTATNAFATDNSTTVAYIGGSAMGTVIINVLPTGFGLPGMAGSTAYVSSLLTASSGDFNNLGFTTFVSQNNGVFTPGFQSIPAGTLGASGPIYSQFTRDGANFGLSNRTTYVLPSGGDAVSTSGTSRVTLVRPAGTQTTPIPTPEPATLALALAGLPLVAFRVWRGRRALAAA